MTETVKRFEELNVYQRARELTNQIYELTRQPTFSRDYSLIDQIRRASVSIMSNIGEGFEKGTNAEFIQALFVAKGSCAEVRVQLQIALDQKYLDPETYANVSDKCRMISGMIANLIKYLRGVKSSKVHRMKY